MQESVESVVNNACKELAVVVSDRRAKPQQQQQHHPHPTQPLKCPRCESMNTKFCYYNNYNLSQPRHFCKNCRRYWTKGGSLRNVPVGGGCRKNKRSNKTKNGGGDRNNSTEKSASRSVSSSGKCGGGSGGGANSSSSSLVNNKNIQDGSDKSNSIGFDSECKTTNNNNNNNSAVSCSFSSGLPHQIFNPEFHQVPQLLNSSNRLSSVSYENPQFGIDPAVISGSFNWSLADMQWKQQQSLTSLLTDGRTPFDGSAITEPPPLLEDITSLGEAALSRFTKSAPALSWPSLLQDDDSLSNTNLNIANNNESNTHIHAFDWRTNGHHHHHHNEGGFLELQSDLGSWGGANWPDLGGSYAPGTSLP